MRDAASTVEEGDDAFVTSSIAFDELLTARDDDFSASRVCPTWMLHVEGGMKRERESEPTDDEKIRAGH